MQSSAGRSAKVSIETAAVCIAQYMHRHAYMLTKILHQVMDKSESTLQTGAQSACVSVHDEVCQFLALAQTVHLCR